LGVVVFILLVALVLAAMIGAGSYSYRRYWSPAGSEVVETGGDTTGAGAGIAAAVVALLVLIVLFFGFAQWNWFGTRSATPVQNPTVSSPAPAPSGGATNASPSAQASPSK
jgi:hypothetical protein